MPLLHSTQSGVKKILEGAKNFGAGAKNFGGEKFLRRSESAFSSWVLGGWGLSCSSGACRGLLVGLFSMFHCEKTDFSICFMAENRVFLGVTRRKNALNKGLSSYFIPIKFDFYRSGWSWRAAGSWSSPSGRLEGWRSAPSVRSPAACMALSYERIKRHVLQWLTHGRK